MAFEKTSEPGIITLSPSCRPEMESTIAVSSVVMPLTLMERIIYSLGTFAFWSACRSGSTEVTFEVSCARETDVIAHKTLMKARDKNRCMIINSVNKAMGNRSLGGKLTVNFKRNC